MAEPANIQKIVRKTFEKHNIDDVSLQNALTEILEQVASSNSVDGSSKDILSEKLRDEPRQKE